MSGRPEVRMGNDIARQFAHLPSDTATTAIAAHLHSFWERRMLEALRDAVASGDDEVDPLLRDATAKL